MAADRYTRIVLTLIAAELLWLGLARTAPPVAAQAAPTPVVITGIDVNPAGAFLPVGIVGSYRGIPPSAGRTLGPLSMSVSGSVLVETIRPIKVESDRPLKVESVDYTPRARPGE